MRELFLLEPDAEEAGWQERALCAQTDPEAFFPEKGGSTREAKKVCLTCDVRDDCLEYALHERRALRHLGRTLRAGASQAEEARRLTRVRAERRWAARRRRSATHRPLGCRGDGHGAPGQPWRRPVAAGRARGHRRPDPTPGPAASRSTPAARTTAPSWSSRLGCGRPDHRAARHRVRRGRRPGALSSLEAAETDWVWILHDDANPAPDGSGRAAGRGGGRPPRPRSSAPSSASGRRCAGSLEVGVTISGTGRRETGLERGEYDQGQHDDVREVLAVNTAGMLVRRSVLDELDGFDRQLPVFGNDVDFGWRAANAGHRTLVVPQAVVFHAEAAHRGTRRTPLTGRHTHYQERRAALYTLLANGTGWSLPFRTGRLLVGTVLRSIGFLLVRSVGESLDELAALVLDLHPSGADPPRAAGSRPRTAPPTPDRSDPCSRRRGCRSATHSTPSPTSWSPDRYQAQDVAERRRAAALAAEASGPRSGLTSRTRTSWSRTPGSSRGSSPTRWRSRSPCSWCWPWSGPRSAFGDVSGGALSPAPDRAADWWRLYGQYWHPLGTGSDIPASAYLVPLALLGRLLAGRRLRRGVGGAGAGRARRLLGRVALPAGGGTAGQRRRRLPLDPRGRGGRLRVGPRDAAAPGARRGSARWSTATVLPWLAHAALGFGDPEPDRRWRAGVAHRTAARAGHGVHAGPVGLRAAADRWWCSSRGGAGRIRRPPQVGARTAAHGAGRGPRAAGPVGLPLVTAGAWRRACWWRPDDCRRPRSASRTCCSAGPRRRGRAGRRRGHRADARGAGAAAAELPDPGPAVLAGGPGAAADGRACSTVSVDAGDDHVLARPRCDWWSCSREPG